MMVERLKASDLRPKVLPSCAWPFELRIPAAASPQACILKPQALSLKPRGRRGRPGITLLEVLISMFVLLVGLLGVASLIPVGKFEVQRGAKIDRAAACGRAAFRDIKVRGMLNPRTWALANTSGTAVFSTPAGIPLFRWDSTPSGGAGTDVSAFVIDPLGVHDGDTSGTRSFGGAFPVPTSGTAAPPSVSTATTVPLLLPRITLGPAPMTQATRVAAADSVFFGQDDLVFETPDNPDVLPGQVLQGGGRRLSQGDYSWLATVVPDPNLVNQSNWGDVPWRVSVAVFYKRNLGTQGGDERVCTLDPAVVNMQDEVRLRVEAAAVAPQYAGDGKKHLDVKPGQWIMLAGFVDPDGGGPIPVRHHFRWHRIVAADETQGTTGPWTRNVTLVGPFTEPNGVNVPVTNVTAYLFDGVIAVYEKNMKLEFDSMYQ